MATKDDKTLLEFEIGVTPNKAIAEISRFGKGFTKRMKEAEANTKKLDKGMLKFVRQVKGMQQQNRGIREMNRGYQKLEVSIKDDIAALKAMNRELRGTTGDERKNIFTKIRKAQDAMNTRGKLDEQDKAKKIVEEASVFNFKELIEGAEEAGDALSEPMRELFNKDAPAMFKRATGVLAYGMDKTVGAFARKFGGKIEDRLERAALKMHDRGDKLKAKGGASAIAGQGLKGLAGMSNALSSVVSMFAKIGPIISMASSFMLSFVKIMIDAESAAKDFNKQLLSTSGTAEFMDGMRSTQEGVEALDKSLTASRAGYEDFSNVQWGISKDIAAGFKSALMSEGMSLRKFDDEISRSAGYVRDHSTAVQMGVAYSRAFGVSLNEISQMQGDMMSNIGMGMDSVEASFQAIKAGASDAGMASSKFFGIVRSFSADLTLFSLRMEDVTKVLKTLSKTMDPREAQKFLQEVSKQYTGGIADNLKHAVVAGDINLKQEGSAQLEDKLSTLIPQIASALSKAPDDPQLTELIRIIKDPGRHPRAIAKWADQQDAKLNSGLMSAITKASIFADRQTTQVGRAANLADYGPLGKVKVQLAEMRNLLKNSNLQLTDLSRLGDAELLAVVQSGTASVKNLESLQALAYGAHQLQMELVQRVRSGIPLSDKDLSQLSKLGVGAGPDAVKQLEAIFDQDRDLSRTFASMDRTQMEQLADSADTIDFQKKTADFQVSLMDKLGVLSDIWLSRIYEVLHAIWLDIEDFAAKFDGKGDFGVAERAAARTGNPEIIKAFKDNQGNLGDATKTAIEGVGRQLIEKVAKAQKEAADLQSKIDKETDEGSKKAMQDRLKQLKVTDEVAGFKKKDLYSIAQSDIEGMGHTEVIRILGRLDKATAALGYGTSAGTGAGTSATPSPMAGPSPMSAPYRVTQDPPTATSQEATTAAIQEQNRAMQADGIKLDKGTISGPLNDSMSKAVYTGASQALFEYYMYSGLDRASVSASMSAGVSPQAIQGIGMTGMAPSTALASLTAANVTHAPAGAGQLGQAKPGAAAPIQVELVLKKDLAKFIDARVTDGAAAHDRNRRLR